MRPSRGSGVPREGGRVAGKSGLRLQTKKLLREPDDAILDVGRDVESEELGQEREDGLGDLMILDGPGADEVLLVKGREGHPDDVGAANLGMETLGGKCSGVLRGCLGVLLDAEGMESEIGLEDRLSGAGAEIDPAGGVEEADFLDGLHDEGEGLDSGARHHEGRIASVLLADSVGEEQGGGRGHGAYL